MPLATAARRRLHARFFVVPCSALAWLAWAGCADPAASGPATAPASSHEIVFGTGDTHATASPSAPDTSPEPLADTAPGTTTEATSADDTSIAQDSTPTEDSMPAEDSTPADDSTPPEVTPDSGPACGEQTLALTQVAPASVLLVVDRSNSMKGAKWADAKTAIVQIAVDFGATLRLGLLLFPQAWNDCSVSPVADVPLALSNASPIETTLDAAELFLSTPTASAIAAAGDILGAADHAAPRVIVLATDGQPTCPMGCGTCTAAANGGCFAGSCDLCIDVHACVAHQLTDMVDALAGDGILTYVVGLPGSEAAADTLNAVADAGGTALPGATRYYRATDAASLATTLGTIAGAVTSCSAPVTPVGGSGFAVVRIDGAEVSRDSAHQNGWDLLNGNLVQFYGAACSAAAAPGANVSITWGCKH